jgi:hypothetical protein
MTMAALVKDGALGSLAIWALGFLLGAAFGLIQCLGWWPALKSDSYRIAMYSSSVVVGILTMLVLYVGFISLARSTTGTENHYQNGFPRLIALVLFTAALSTTFILYTYLSKVKSGYVSAIK